MSMEAVVATLVGMFAIGGGMIGVLRYIINAESRNRDIKMLEGRAELKEHFRVALDEQLVKINGTYVKKEVLTANLEAVKQRIKSLEDAA